ncbi:MAG: hypothetical protein KAG56_07885 [Sulfurovaceae bacterium]|nr:hypothetical protein [Sulfurovaceae bacterium]
MNFEKEIAPFIWCKHEDSVSIILNVGIYKNEIFKSREDEGFEGGGYDWASLAQVFLDEKASHLKSIKFDPEGSMFCVYSSEEKELKEFILAFKNACEESELILDLFSRAELD